MDNLSLPSFSKKSVIPCFVRKRDVTQSFASLSMFILRFVGLRNIKHHSPLCRNTEYQISFPGLSKFGVSNVIPRFIEIRNIKCHSPIYRITERKKRLSPVCRITEVHSNSVFSSVIPCLSEDEMSKVSSPVCLVQRCHQSKCLFLQTISLQIHFKIFQCLFKILFSFHLSSYNYQHGSGQSFSPSGTAAFPSRVGSLSSTNLGILVFLFIQNKSSSSSYIHNYITNIHNILSQKWCTCI